MASKNRISVVIRNSGALSLTLPTRDEVDQMDLSQALSNPVVLGFMKAFAAKQYCDENLKFFINVEQWLDGFSVKNESDRAAGAMEIYNGFICKDSPNEICLSSTRVLLWNQD